MEPVKILYWMQNGKQPKPTISGISGKRSRKGLDTLLGEENRQAIVKQKPLRTLILDERTRAELEKINAINYVLHDQWRLTDGHKLVIPSFDHNHLQSWGTLFDTTKITGVLPLSKNNDAWYVTEDNNVYRVYCERFAELEKEYREINGFPPEDPEPQKLRSWNDLIFEDDLNAGEDQLEFEEEDGIPRIETLGNSPSREELEAETRKLLGYLK